jgi:hypothetical protein
MPLAARIAFAVCVVAAAVAGQDARFTHTGRVFDVKRKPVANAQVTLVGAGVCEGIDDGDVVHVDSDNEGRFRAQLQPARAYVAWAAVPDDGGFVVSPTIDVGAMPTELVVADKVAGRLRIEPTEAWRALGPLRVEVAPNECPGLVIRGALDDAGTMELPPLPPTFARVRVFAKDIPVYQTIGRVHEPFALAPPQHLRVRVVDEKDQPVAGATVERVLWHWWSREAPFVQRPTAQRHAVATTGDDGTAEVLLTGAKDPPGLFALHATREGRGDGIAGIASGPIVDGKIVAAADLHGVLPIRLHAPRTIRVFARDREMPAIVQLTGRRRLPTKTEFTEITDCARAPIRGGTLTLEAPWSTDCRLEIPWPSLALAADDPWQRSARPLPLVLPPSALDENELDLRAVLPLRLQVLDATAGPAIGARILCSAAIEGGFVLPHRALQVIADRSGRVVLPILPGKWFVLGVLDHSVAHAVVEAAPGLAPQTLQLRPLDCMRVHVVDAGGRAIAGARFSWFDLSSRSGPTSRNPEEMMTYVAGMQITSWAMQRCRSVANGDADVWFLAPSGPTVLISADGLQTNVTLEANEQRVPIVLR